MSVNIPLHIREQYAEIYWRTSSTVKERIDLGFRYYKPRHRILKWARMLSSEEIPRWIEVWGDRLRVDAGYFLIYDPTSTPTREEREIVFSNQYAKFEKDFDHWPIEPNLFAKTYSLYAIDYPNYDELTERFVDAGGFVPVYKSAGIWAKPVTIKTAISGIEHGESAMQLSFTEVPMGSILALGYDGEPYFMRNEKFVANYNQVPHITEE